MWKNNKFEHVGNLVYRINNPAICQKDLVGTAMSITSNPQIGSYMHMGAICKYEPICIKFGTRFLSNV